MDGDAKEMELEIFIDKKKKKKLRKCVIKQDETSKFCFFLYGVVNFYLRGKGV